MDTTHSDPASTPPDPNGWKGSSALQNNDARGSLSHSTTPPEKLVTRLIEVMSAFYGSKFTDQWRGTDPTVMATVWRQHLAGYTKAELAHGVEQCKTLKWPPTLPEFLMLCRPPMDYASAFVEAAENLRLRETGHDRWSHPAIYHAAASMAWEVRTQPYKWNEARWRIALDRARADERCAEVPPRPAALIEDRTRHAPTSDQLDALRAAVSKLTRLTTSMSTNTPPTEEQSA